MSKRVLILGIDGYLGWTLALWLGARGYKVFGVDNFARRRVTKEVGAGSIVPISDMGDRLAIARDKLGIEIVFKNIDVMHAGRLGGFLEKVQPDVIVHYAENPSPAYSMIDSQHAAHVQVNNVIGTLGLLFLIRDICPDAVLLKLGTMGEYGTPMGGRPLFEGFFPEGSELKWRSDVWDVSGELTSRSPGSFYHASKVQDSINVRCACKWWGLKSYDIMQGVIYGVHTDEVASDWQLRTRLDIDECFGTVVNRYVAQATIGFPLTVFGEGGQARSFIALSDAMRCMELMINRPLEAGTYEVVNQWTGVHTVAALAGIVAGMANVDVIKVGHTENPRVEAPQHPYQPVNSKLLEMGFAPKVTVCQEVERMFELMSRPRVQERIEAQRELILPETWWGGEKRRVRWL